MHKEELIHLHTLLVQVKRFFENTGYCDNFQGYRSLHISPVHIHRSKADHKKAIFVLGNELVSVISNDELYGSDGTSAHMQDLADRAVKTSRPR